MGNYDKNLLLMYEIFKKIKNFRKYGKNIEFYR